MNKKIPDEMRFLDQWVAVNIVWNKARNKYDKFPVNPRTLGPGSVSDPSTWSSYEQALAVNGNVGFVLQASDPYVIIDLDTHDLPDRIAAHSQIITQTNSYAERSHSQKGFHIVVKGTLEAGLHDEGIGVEIYPHGRFILMTGDNVNDHSIADGQELIDWLAGQIAARRFKQITDLKTTPSNHTDEEIYEQACRAANGEKFKDLYEGRWEDYQEYKHDHSRADLGLLVFIDYYTKDVEQAVRIFQRSALYRSSKGRASGDGRDYIERTLRGARARNTADHPEADIDVGRKAAANILANFAATKPVPAAVPNTPQEVATAPVQAPARPPGLLGDIADYIYQTSIRPVAEVALAASLALLAGITGRQYNIPGSGLNQYIILLAATGSGKEGGASGVSRLTAAVREIEPAIDNFAGPSDFASGQALVKSLGRQPAMYCMLGEFGQRLQTMADSRAPASEKALQRMLLNFYSRSGKGQVEGALVYSDKEKNTESIEAPALTIYGEAPPEVFFSNLDETQINSGLLPRFLFIEYTGERPPINEATAFGEPQPELVQRIASLVTSVSNMAMQESVQLIEFDSDAKALLKKFNIFCDNRINSGTEVHKQLWNRAHLKALRLSGLLSVGIDHYHPKVNAECATWATAFVCRDIATIEKRFSANEVGQGEHRYESHVRRVIAEYLGANEKERARYRIADCFKAHPQVVPFSYIRQRLRQLSVFKDDRRGVKKAIELALEDMVDAGILQSIPPLQRMEMFNKQICAVYMVGDSW